MSALDVVREELLNYFKQKHSVESIREMCCTNQLRNTFEEDEESFEELKSHVFSILMNQVSFYRLSADLRDYCGEEEPETEDDRDKASMCSSATSHSG
jgi:hypothetical protein